MNIRRSIPTAGVATSEVTIFSGDNSCSKSVNLGVTELLKSLLNQKNERAGGGPLWSRRALTFVDVIMDIERFTNQTTGSTPQIKTLIKLNDLRFLCEIYLDASMPTRFKTNLGHYFKTLQDFDLKRLKGYAFEQAITDTIMRQHDYVSMQVIPALNVLENEYGYIFEDEVYDID